MGKWRILIIEDVKHELDYLKMMLMNDPEFSEFEVIGESNRTKDGLTLVQNTNPDGILLDISIQTEGSKAGLDFAIELNKQKNRPWIIFITGNPKDHSAEITERNIYHDGFIKKPFGYEDINSALTWIKNKYPSEKSIIITHYATNCNNNTKLVSYIKPKEIVYIQKNKNKNTSTIHICNDCKDLHNIQNSISFFEVKLAPYNIEKIEQGVLLNLDYLHSFDKKNKVVYTKCCSTQLPVGSTYIEEFLLRIKKL
jgi:DNA-binding LytR/AlgR family response regulator